MYHPILFWYYSAVLLDPRLMISFWSSGVCTFFVDGSGIILDYVLAILVH